MDKIIRTPTRAEGGITSAEKAQMDEIVKKWTKNAFKTDTIDKDKITKAIKGIYKAANLNEPIVVVVPSPLVMAFSYGLASGIWYLREKKNDLSLATDLATDSATRLATFNATSLATGSAMRSATDSATRSAMRSATYSATSNATDSATDSATFNATRSATRLATSNATDSATRSATDNAMFNATDSATGSATFNAMFNATDLATRSATDSATYDATDSATYDATDLATYDATDLATDSATYSATVLATRSEWLSSLALYFGGTKENADFLISCIPRWVNNYQGGNMWSYFGAYAEAMRDVIGLTGLDCWKKYKSWEDASIEGGFRVMHEKFCIVSDFPKTLLVDEQNRPHCDSGPSHEWRDGFKIFHLHGVRFDEEMHRKLTTGDFTLEELHDNNNLTADQRAEALFWLPPEKLLEQVKAKLIHTGIKGTKLYKVPKILDAKNQYCMLMEHPTIPGRMFIEWVDPKVGKLKNADLAQCYAWQDEDGNPIPLEDYLNCIEA